MRVQSTINSSVIEQIAYDTYKQELVVTINGNDYFYYKVSFEKFRKFYEADSKGSFFNMYVKGRW